MRIKNVTEFLEERAAEFPNKTAIIDANGHLSFNEFRQYSRKIATEVIKNDIFRSPVVIFLEKSKESIVAFLGVAYSGNCYVPIDVEMPINRINLILNKLKPKMVITSRKYYELFSKTNYGEGYIFIDDLNSFGIDDDLLKSTMKKMIDADLLYVLFTSGSTGEPKGVCINHRSVIDFTEWVGDTFELSDKDVIGNQAPFYFDNSILDIYGMIRNGATLDIIPPELFSFPMLLLNHLNERRITFIFWVPSALKLVVNLRALKEVKLETVQKILFAGEVMPNKHLNIWRQYHPNALYANLYGPTEITDVCAYYIVDRDFDDAEPLPIGRPCDNTDIIVLNEHNQLVGCNEIGELCVRGSSLSPGYYNNPEKTKLSFVQNPLNNLYPEMIYRTGDLVKYNERGEIIYISRKDYQIKHKGYRIELGEIENAANSLEYMPLCCCLYDEKRSKIILIIENNIERETLLKDLSRLIPEYMLPERIIKVEKIPLNSNGKIDRNKLKNDFL